MEDTAEIRTMRMMAWSRAKGELDSMLSSYWEDGANRYGRMNQLIKELIENVEMEGLQE